jgi:Alpha galactosidase C-terminal beta sandwich domain/Alpha galactosidase A
MRSRQPAVLAVATALVAAVAAMTPVAEASAPPTAREPTQSARTGDTNPPYLGWSSWSLQATDYPGTNPRGDYSWLTEENVLAQADVMAAKLKRHGYRYLNLDAGWWRKWDWTPLYDRHGRYAVDRERFPRGLDYVSDYVHRKGLKLGIYVPVGLEKGAYDNGDFPIAGAPGCSTHDVVYDDLRATNGWDSSYAMDFGDPCAQAYIDSLARQYARWRVDFLKIDGVGYGSWRTPEGETVPGQYDNRADIAAWNEAFAKVDRDVEIQLSWSLSHDYVRDWQRLSDSWRINSDVECYCETLVRWGNEGGSDPGGVLSRFTAVLPWIDAAGWRHGWNNLDTINVGNGEMDGLTRAERRSYMTLWAIEASPLYLGDDLTRLDPYGLKLITNDEVIAINQAGRPAKPLDTSTDQQVWVAPYRGGYVVALFNLGDAAATVSVDWSELGEPGRARVRDVWAHRSLGTSTGFAAELPAHGSRLLVVTPT